MEGFFKFDELIYVNSSNLNGICILKASRQQIDLSLGSIEILSTSLYSILHLLY